MSQLTNLRGNFPFPFEIFRWLIEKSFYWKKKNNQKNNIILIVIIQKNPNSLWEWVKHSECELFLCVCGGGGVGGRWIINTLIPVQKMTWFPISFYSLAEQKFLFTSKLISSYGLSFFEVRHQNENWRKYCKKICNVWRCTLKITFWEETINYLSGIPWAVECWFLYFSKSLDSI